MDKERDYEIATLRQADQIDSIRRVEGRAIVLLVAYLLRDFFFVVFSTFLICYSVQRAVKLILKRIPAGKQTVFVQRATTVGVFAAFVALFVGLAWLIFPWLFTQAKAVLLHVKETNIQAETEQLLDRTIGGYLYQRRFGGMQSTEFQKLIDEHEASENTGMGWWQTWPSIQTAWQIEQLKDQSRFIDEQ